MSTRWPCVRRSRRLAEADRHHRRAIRHVRRGELLGSGVTRDERLRLVHDVPRASGLAVDPATRDDDERKQRRRRREIRPPIADRADRDFTSSDRYRAAVDRVLASGRIGRGFTLDEQLLVHVGVAKARRRAAADSGGDDQESRADEGRNG